MNCKVAITKLTILWGVSFLWSPSISGPTEGPWKDLQIAQGATNLQWAVEDISGMPKITEALCEGGYSEEDIRKVLGENFLRVLEEVCCE